MVEALRAAALARCSPESPSSFLEGYIGIVGDTLGNGKENGNYYTGAILGLYLG